MRDGVRSLLKCHEKPEEFDDYISNLLKSKSQSQLGEDLQVLQSNELNIFINTLKKLIEENVVDINQDCKRMNGVLMVLNAMIDSEYDTKQIIEVLGPIHDNLLQYNDRNSYTQNNCSKVLEKCWGKSLRGSDQFAVNVPLYLLARSLCPIGKLEDVQRLNDIKDMLCLIDFNCSSSSSLLSLLCSTASNQLFFKTKEGIQFLSFCLVLSEEVMTVVDDSLKSTIPLLKDSQLLNVGKVYYEALLLANEKGLVAHFGKQCLENLIECALYRHRVGPYKSSAKFGKVLNVVNKKKRDIIGDIWYNSYNVLLWKALSATNGHVRANGAAMLFDVFPFVHPCATKVQYQDAFEGQCAKIQELMMDDEEVVRVVAGRGCGQLLSDHWATMSIHYQSTLLTMLCNELSHDASSCDVIVSAIQGIEIVLSNSATHLALKKFLPCLQNHFYHPAASVKNCMISLLQKLRRTSLFKLSDLISVDEMLNLMAGMKSGAPKKSLSAILVDKYFPANSNTHEQIALVLDMLREHKTVHRAFFVDAYPHIGVNTSLKLVLGLLKAVKECPQKTASPNLPQLENEDTATIGLMLEVCAVLLSVSHRDVTASEQCSTKVCKKIVPLIPDLLKQFSRDPVCNEALSLMIANLPDEGLQTLKKHCVTICRNKNSSSAVLTSICLAMIQIRDADSILSRWNDVIKTKLESVLKAGVVDPETASSQAGAPVTGFAGNITRALSNILSSPQLPLLLDHSMIDELYCTLMATSDIIPPLCKRELRNEHVGMLAECLGLAARLCIHIGGADDLVQVVTCLQSVVESKRPGNSHRCAIVKAVLPACVEGFQVLQYCPSLLTSLYHTIHQLGSAEQATHRLSVCKFLYRAGSFLSNNLVPDLDICAVADQLVRGAAQSAGTLRELRDVQCLLLEIGVTLHKQEVCGSKGNPWSGFVDQLIQILLDVLSPHDQTISSKSELPPFVQVIVDCLESSETFSHSFLPALQSAAIEHETVNQVALLIGR